MVSDTRDPLRRIGAFCVATVLFWAFAAPVLASGPFDPVVFYVIFVFYVAFVSLTRWLVAHDRVTTRQESESVRAGWEISKWILLSLVAIQAIAISFWAMEVYLFDSKRYVTPYERNDELPKFLVIGAIAGSAVAIAGAAFVRK